MVLILYYFTRTKINSYAAILITFICVMLIVAKCPIENKNKPIPEEKKRFHKIMAALLCTIYGVVGIVLIAFSNKYGVLILYTFSAVSVLIIAAMLQDGRCKYEKQKEKR